MSLVLKEINGFMLNVTDQYCILHLLAKEGFPVFLYPVPERPIIADPGLKVLPLFCIYLHMHC